MDSMPDEVQSHFLNGQNTLHHSPGIFNGMWSEMAIETTFMRYGHGQGCTIGITLRPETLITWAHCLLTYNKVVCSLTTMREKDPESSQTTQRKRTGKG